MTPENIECCENTDKEIWREPTKKDSEGGSNEGMEPHVFVTIGGGVGMNHYGTCIVRTIKEWVRLARKETPCHIKSPSDKLAFGCADIKPDTGALTPLGEALQAPCARCEKPWIIHDCPVKGSGATPAHIGWEEELKQVAIAFAVELANVKSMPDMPSFFYEAVERSFIKFATPVLQTARTQGGDEGYQECWQHFKDMDAFQLGAKKERERLIQIFDDELKEINETGTLTPVGETVYKVLEEIRDTFTSDAIISKIEKILR